MGKQTFIQEGGKIPPQNIEAEKVYLGAIINDPHKIYYQITLIKPEMFFHEAHAVIYKAMLTLLSENKPIDVLLISECLKREDKLESIGGSHYLQELSNMIKRDIPIREISIIIVEKWMRRSQITICQDYLKTAFEDTNDPFETIDKNISELEKVIQFKKASVDFKNQVNKAITLIRTKKENTNTNFFQLHDADFAQNISLQPNRITLIPSNRGEGKTSFLTWMADGLLTKNENLSIIWFSFEDSINSMILKFISMRSNLTAKQLNSENYTLTPSDEERVLEAGNFLSSSDWNVEFVDSPCSIQEIKRRVKQHQDKYKGYDTVVIIDNFGLIDKKGIIGTDIEKDEEIAREIVAMKQETNACVLIPHHLTKEASDKTNLSTGYRVTEKHVRGSGRLLDYFPQCLALVRPGNHKDVVEMYEEADDGISTNAFISLNYDNFESMIWTLNPRGNVIEAFTLLQDAYREELKSNNPRFSFATIVKKWQHEIKSINKANMGRESKYLSKLPEFTKWFTEGGYLKEIASSIPFDDYYYGDMKDAEKPPICNLFIVETIRDRFDSKKVFKFRCEMEYNKFERII